MLSIISITLEKLIEKILRLIIYSSLILPPQISKFINKLLAILPESPSKTFRVNRNSMKSSSMSKKKTSFSEYYSFRFQGTIHALFVEISNAQAANCPTTKIFSASILSTLPRMSTVKTKRLTLSCIGGRMRKILRNFLMRLKKKMIALLQR